MWQDKLKKAGVSIHVMATGAGANLQQRLWETPGASSYLSGASFPYAAEEQEELLGFMPEHFCSQEAAVDLASAAYMKAYRFGGKKPVGLGITASVTSDKPHRGDHRIFACLMTDDKVLLTSHTLFKGCGDNIPYQREFDGQKADHIGIYLLDESFETGSGGQSLWRIMRLPVITDATQLAMDRFMERPFFAANGKRRSTLPTEPHYTLMSGAFNPPHEGHFGIANWMSFDYAKKIVFEITAQPPHKEALSVQQLLQRAKLLQGHDRLFTQKLPLYLDKARAFPKVPLVMGADAMVRMMDPKWGVDFSDMLCEFSRLDTELYIVGREVDGKFITRSDIVKMLPREQQWLFLRLSHSLDGRWDISSTELRNKKA